MYCEDSPALAEDPPAVASPQDSGGEPFGSGGDLPRTKSPKWTQKSRPKCLADGCKLELNGNGAYNLRYRLCEDHIKAMTLFQGGVAKRFCQQCSRLHEMSEFEGKRRSCISSLRLHKQRQRAKLLKKQMESEAASGSPSSSFSGGELQPLLDFPPNAKPSPTSKVSFAEELQHVRTFISDSQPVSYGGVRPYSAGNSPRGSHSSDFARPYSTGTSPRVSFGGSSAASAYSSDNSPRAGYIEPPLGSPSFSPHDSSFEQPMNPQDNLNMEMRRIIVEIRGEDVTDTRRLDVPQMRPQHSVPSRSKTVGNFALGDSMHAQPTPETAMPAVGTLSGRARTWGGGQEELRRLSEEVAMETAAAAAASAGMQIQHEVPASLPPHVSLAMDTPSFGPPRGLHGLTTQRPGGQQLSNNFSTFRISSPAGSLPSSQPTTPGRPTTSTAFQGSAFLEDVHPPLSLGHHNHQYQQPHQQPGGVNIRQHMPHFHSLQQPTPDQLFDMLPSLMDPNYGHPRSDGGY